MEDFQIIQPGNEPFTLSKHVATSTSGLARTMIPEKKTVLPEGLSQDAVRMNVRFMEDEFKHQTDRLDQYHGIDLPGWVDLTLPAPLVFRDAMAISEHLQNNLHIVLTRLMARKIMDHPLNEFETYLAS